MPGTTVSALTAICSGNLLGGPMKNIVEMNYKNYCLIPALALIVCAPLVNTSANAQAREQNVSDAPASGLQAGVGRADISPPRGIAQMNWGSATHIESTGMDPAGMYATAIMLSDGTDRVCIVSIDHVNVEPFRNAVTRASEELDLNPQNIFLVATHTHSGPAVDSSKGPAGVNLAPYVNELKRHFAATEDKIVGAIIEANGNLEPAHIYGGHGMGTININRRFREQDGFPPAVGRNPDGFVDKELVVFRVDDSVGTPTAILVNFQAHGTVLGAPNTYISPDWIGGLRQTMESTFPGARVIFLQGAAGDQAPIEGYTGDLAVAHRLGATLGLEASAIALQIDTVIRQPVFEGYVQSTAIQAKQYWHVNGSRDSNIEIATSTFDAPRRTYSKQEIATMKSRLDAARLDLAATSANTWANYQAKAKVRRLADLYHSWSHTRSGKHINVQLRALRIGKLAIVAFPGEAFARLGSEIKQASPFDFTMFVGYVDGPGGSYLPTSDEYTYGGYEVEVTRFDPGADKLLVEKSAELLNGLYRAR